MLFFTPMIMALVYGDASKNYAVILGTQVAEPASIIACAPQKERGFKENKTFQQVRLLLFQTGGDRKTPGTGTGIKD